MVRGATSAQRPGAHPLCGAKVDWNPKYLGIFSSCSVRSWRSSAPRILNGAELFFPSAACPLCPGPHLATGPIPPPSEEYP